MKLTVDEFKDIQLEILKVVHYFCEEHDIKYYLTYGTLLGAIRHKGYIPWDDDIDICMVRDDYEKFMGIFNSEQNRYKFVSYETDKNFLYTFGKVIDTNTKLIEDSKINYNLGINIDIFPIDGIDNDIFLLKKQSLLRKFINIKTINYSRKRSFIKNLILAFGKISLCIIPTRIFIEKMIKNSKLHSYEKSQQVCCVVMGTESNKPFPKDYFNKRKLVEFENNYFYVPTEYDGYLRSMFGNYMKLPPKEQQVTHHVFEAYKMKEE